MGFTWMMWKFGIRKRDLMRVVNSMRDACYSKRERLLAEKLDAAYLTSYTHADDNGNFTVTTTGGDALALTMLAQVKSFLIDLKTLIMGNKGQAVQFACAA